MFIPLLKRLYNTVAFEIGNKQAPEARFADLKSIETSKYKGPISPIIAYAVRRPDKLWDIYTVTIPDNPKRDDPPTQSLKDEEKTTLQVFDLLDKFAYDLRGKGWIDLGAQPHAEELTVHINQAKQMLHDEALSPLADATELGLEQAELNKLRADYGELPSPPPLIR